MENMTVRTEYDVHCIHNDICELWMKRLVDQEVNTISCIREGLDKELSSVERMKRNEISRSQQDYFDGMGFEVKHILDDLIPHAGDEKS